MNLDKTLKTHQINPLSYISVDDFGDNSHKCKGNLRSQAARLTGLGADTICQILDPILVGFGSWIFLKMVFFMF